MPNTREIVRALVSAFNVHNYARDTVKTNFTIFYVYSTFCTCSLSYIPIFILS